MGQVKEKNETAVYEVIKEQAKVLGLQLCVANSVLKNCMYFATIMKSKDESVLLEKLSSDTSILLLSFFLPSRS
jgi:hypothetical protein